jgi:hypothetical protein
MERLHADCRIIAFSDADGVAPTSGHRQVYSAGALAVDVRAVTPYDQTNADDVANAFAERLAVFAADLSALAEGRR